MLFRLAGTLYRFAQEPEAETPEEKPKADPTHEMAVGWANGLIQKFGLVAEPPQFTREGDGEDVSYVIHMPNTIDGHVTFDFEYKKGKALLREVVAEICRVGYVGSSEVEMVQLLQAFGTLTQMKTPSTSIKPPDQKQKQEGKTRDWLETYLPPVLVSLEKELKQEPNLKDREGLVRLLTQHGKGNKLGDATLVANIIKVLSKISDDTWNALIAYLQSSRGRFTPSRRLVDQKIKELTAHEQYNGEVEIIKSDKDRLIVALDTPAPFEDIMLVLSRKPGQNQLDLVTAGFKLCGGKVLETGPDDKAFKTALSAMVDLVLLSQNAANPRYSPPPGETEYETKGSWNEQQYKAAVAKSVFITEYAGDVINFWTAGEKNKLGEGDGGCMPKQNLAAMWKDKNSQLNLVREKYKQIYYVTVDGDVYQLGNDGEPIDTLLYHIERNPNEACV